MAQRPDRKEIEELIAQGHEMAAKARKMVDDSRQMFARRGITPETCLDELRRVGGEDAVQKVLDEAREMGAALEQELRRDRMHRGRSSGATRSMQLRARRL